MTAITNPVSAGQCARLLPVKLAAGFVLAASFASAEEYRWGVTDLLPDASYIVTHPGEGAGHVASLVFTNRLNGGVFHARHELFEGVRIVVTIRDQSGDVPDELTVEVPDGFLAIPPAISVEEDSSGTIEIFEASEVPLS